MVGQYIPLIMEMDKLTEIVMLMLAMESKFKANTLMSQPFSIHIFWGVSEGDQTMNLDNLVPRILGTVWHNQFLMLQ